MSSRRVLLLGLLLVILVCPRWAMAATDLVQSGDIVVPAGEKIFGDVVCLQGDVEVYGEVFGDVVALLGRVTIYPDGVVQGDVVTLVGSIDLRSGGRIGGEQVSLGGISGIRSISPWRGLFKNTLGRTIFNLITRVLIAVIVGALFPRALARVAAKIETQVGPSAGAGILVWLAALPLTVVAALTIIGIPLALIVLVGLWAAYHLGFAAISWLTGTRVCSKSEEGNLGAVALGALLFSLLLAVPLLGWMIRFALALVGVGAVLLTRFGTERAAKE